MSRIVVFFPDFNSVTDRLVARRLATEDNGKSYTELSAIDTGTDIWQGGIAAADGALLTFNAESTLSPQVFGASVIARSTDGSDTWTARLSAACSRTSSATSQSGMSKR